MKNITNIFAHNKKKIEFFKRDLPKITIIKLIKIMLRLKENLALFKNILFII